MNDLPVLYGLAHANGTEKYAETQQDLLSAAIADELEAERAKVARLETEVADFRAVARGST